MARELLPVKPYFLSRSDDAAGLKFLNREDREPKRLASSDFSRLLLESMFSPCPMGNVQLECYRPYEALECGSIPIVEKRLTMDYFRELLGDHPMPTVRSWSEARNFLQDMQRRPAEIDALQDRCMSWWEDYKQVYREQVTDFICNRSADSVPVQEPIMSKTYSIPGWRVVELLRHHDVSSMIRRIQRQADRLFRQGKLRVAFRPGAK